MTDEKEILNSSRVIAVVGISPSSQRPSYRVASYLKQQGYRIVPVNPRVRKVMGEISYPDLLSIPGKVDVVDIFRKSEDVLPVVAESIKIGVKAIWMQEGVINEEAASLARNAGLKVVMDRCMLKEHKKLNQ